MDEIPSDLLVHLRISSRRGMRYLGVSGAVLLAYIPLGVVCLRVMDAPSLLAGFVLGAMFALVLHFSAKAGREFDAGLRAIRVAAPETPHDRRASAAE